MFFALLWVVWEGVKRAGGGVASALCDTPTGRSDASGRANCLALCEHVCACTYGLLDVADACRSRHLLPRLHASALDVADACRDRHFITSTTKFRNLPDIRLEKIAKVTSK